MSRKQIKNLHDHDAITFRSDQDEDGRVVVVKGGQRAYLWVAHHDGYVVTLSGAGSLRALAHAILAEVGEAP